jgi:hypothetical protein
VNRHPRRKSEKHLAFIRSLPSLVYNDGTCEAAHIRYAEIMIGKRLTGMAEKPDDMWTVPLSSPAHREQHSMSERAFWARHGINPLIIAALLWTQSSSGGPIGRP